MADTKVATNERPLTILLSKGKEVPYAETAQGAMLSTVNKAVLGQILTINDSFQLEEGLVKSWRYNPKDLTYELELRSNLYFHNGRKVTSNDLEFSLLRGFFTSHNSFYHMFLGHIEGVEDLKNLKYKTGVCKGIKILNETTISVKLKYPNPSFLYSLTNPFVSIRPIEELNDDYANWKNLPIGAGPFKAISFKEHKLQIERVVKTSNKPNVINLSTAFNKNENYDLLVIQPEVSNANLYNKIYTKYPSSVMCLFFSNKNELGLDINFRKAIKYALNKKEIASLYDETEESHEILPKHFWGRKNLKSVYNLDLAKEYISKVPKNELQKKYEIPFFSGTAFPEEKLKRARLIESQLLKVGIKVSFYPSQEKFISTDTAIKSPFSASGRVTDYVDPILMFSSFYKNSPYINEMPVLNDDYNKLFEAAREAKKDEERHATLEKISSYVDDQVVAIPIIEIKSTYFINNSTRLHIGDQFQPLILNLENIIYN